MSNSDPRESGAPDESTSDSPGQRQTQTEEQEIIERLLKGDDLSETFVFETEHGDLEIDLTTIDDRQKRFDYMSDLPSGWFEAGQKDDPDEVDDFGALIPDGEGIEALEDIVIDAAQSPHIAPSEMELLVRKRMSDEVLTQAGLRVIQMSTDHNADIDGFRRK